jgi:hypothetical protein
MHILVDTTKERKGERKKKKGECASFMIQMKLNNLFKNSAH